MRAIEYPGQGVTLYRSVLPNGLSVYVVPKPGWRKCRAAFVTSFGGADRRFTLEGERCDTPAGVAHYLEHKMFDMPYGSVDSVFAARGADSNAYTSYAVTSYHFTCTDRFEDDLRTLLAFVSTPYFTPETVEKERGIIGQGAELLGWDLDKLLEQTILAMRPDEAAIAEFIAKLS